MSNCAIYLNPEAYDTSKSALMGRHSAGEGFLKGFLDYASVERFYFWNVANWSKEKLATFMARFDLHGKPATLIERAEFRRISEAGAVHVPSPQTAREAWLRRRAGDRAYSITGITHTTATARVMDSMASQMFSPIEDWDALICTSRAVRANVSLQFEATAEYVKAKMGATRVAIPRLYTIPLGLDASAFTPDPEKRRQWREQLEIPQDAIVVLYVGRFSHTGKMNMAPMGLALERAAKQTGREIYWVLSGWAGNEKAEEHFHDATKAFCPSIHYKVVDGRKPENRFSIWSVGDIFISLSDNIQETFGLTPVEAMAAGLPCVVSDWDGYKDTVRHGLDGFRVPTYAPRAGMGTDLSLRHSAEWDSYDVYIGSAAQLTAVDVEVAASSLVKLIENDDLRRTMGETARARAHERFDWRHVIPEYEAVWAELEAIRRRAPAEAPAARNINENPWRMDPFRLYGSYATEWLTRHTVVKLAPGMTVELAVATLSHPLARWAPHLLPRMEEAQSMLAFIAERPQTSVDELVAAFPRERANIIDRGVGWLAKYGVIQILSGGLDIPT